MDGYATPLYVEALNRHRGATVNLRETQVLWDMARTRSPDLNDHSHYRRWSPWVRSYLVAQELLGGLLFEPAVPLKGGKRDEIVLTLNAWEPNAAGKGKGAHLPLVTLVSPNQEVFAGPINKSTGFRENGQLSRVLQWAELREERSAEILAQIENQHVMWGTLVPLHAERMRATRELIEAAIQMSIYVQTRFKHELACWRPIDYSPQVQPMVTTPGHGSLPSGHCTQAYVIYKVLKSLLNTARRPTTNAKTSSTKPESPRTAATDSVNWQLRKMAERISTNRVVAGVHFPVDNVAGRLLGVTLGEYFLRRCGQDLGHQVKKLANGAKNPCQRKKGWIHRKFDGPAFPPDEEFDPASQNLYDDTVKYYPVVEQVDLPKSIPSALMMEMWLRAQKECNELGIRFG